MDDTPKITKLINNVISKVSFTSLFFLVAPKLPILATIALKKLNNNNF